MKFKVVLIALALIATYAPQVRALLVPFTEDFSTGASNWLNAASSSPTWSGNGGLDDSAFISYVAPTFTSGASSPFGTPPFQLMFRANNSADASGDAFVGNWLAGGVTALTLAVRHNYESTLRFYARLDAGAGAAASLAFDAAFDLAPDTWTTINIPILESNPPFLSYGAGTFNSVFSNIQNMQFGLFVPANTEFTGLRMDIASASVVPEPGTVGLVLSGLTMVMLLCRRHRMGFQAR